MILLGPESIYIYFVYNSGSVKNGCKGRTARTCNKIKFTIVEKIYSGSPFRSCTIFSLDASESKTGSRSCA